MNKNTAKNIFIAALVGLCIFQVGWLWFGDMYDLPFSLAFFEPYAPDSETESIAKLVTPYRIITATGKNESAIAYSDLDKLSIKKAADGAIENILRRGDFIRSGAVDYNDWDLDSSVIYEYACPIPTDVFVQHFKQKTNNFLTGRLRRFDRIILIPAGEDLTALFIGENGFSEYRLTKAADYTADISAGRQAEADKTNTIYYERKLTSPDSFLYAAYWRGDYYQYNNITAQNPFGAITQTNLERYVNYFFENPVAKQFQMKEGGIYTFSDDKTVVYYHPSGVLEYLTRQSLSNETVSSFLDSYCVALDLLDRDRTISNSYYLSGYTQQPTGFVFTFECTINDFPLFLSKELSNTTGMNSLIEITIAKDSIKYKRYMAAFEKGYAVSYATEGFESALSEVFGLSGEDNVINSLNLCYKADAGSRLYLFWSVDISGRTFMQSTE